MAALPEVVHLTLNIELDREEDGRWIAEIPVLPGVMAYGPTRAEAVASVQAIALRVIADQIEEEKQAATTLTFACV